MSFKYLTILLLLIVFLSDALVTMAQCSNGLVLAKNDVDSKGEGHLKLKVNANGAFEGRLIELYSDSGISVERFTGTGDQTFSFRHLNSNPDHIYKIEVDFLSEDKFLCKKRVLTDIQFSDN
jgi:hypothetical protein